MMKKESIDGTVQTATDPKDLSDPIEKAWAIDAFLPITHARRKRLPGNRKFPAPATTRLGVEFPLATVKNRVAINGRAILTQNQLVLVIQPNREVGGRTGRSLVSTLEGRIYNVPSGSYNMTTGAFQLRLVNRKLQEILNGIRLLYEANNERQLERQENDNCGKRKRVGAPDEDLGLAKEVALPPLKRMWKRLH